MPSEIAQSWAALRACDFVFVDGAHYSIYPFSDLAHFGLHYAAATQSNAFETTVIVDDCHLMEISESLKLLYSPMYRGLLELKGKGTEGPRGRLAVDWREFVRFFERDSVAAGGEAGDCALCFHGRKINQNSTLGFATATDAETIGKGYAQSICRGAYYVESQVAIASAVD